MERHQEEAELEEEGAKEELVNPNKNLHSTILWDYIRSKICTSKETTAAAANDMNTTTSSHSSGESPQLELLQTHGSDQTGLLVAMEPALGCESSTSTASHFGNHSQQDDEAVLHLLTNSFLTDCDPYYVHPRPESNCDAAVVEETHSHCAGDLHEASALDYLDVLDFDGNPQFNEECDSPIQGCLYGQVTGTADNIIAMSACAVSSAGTTSGRALYSDLYISNLLNGENPYGLSKIDVQIPDQDIFQCHDQAFSGTFCPLFTGESWI